MKYITTRTPGAAGVSFTHALFDGLAPDGGLYVPESVESWSDADRAALPAMSLGALGARVIEPFLRGELDYARLRAIVDDALDFEIPIVEVEPHVEEGKTRCRPSI